MIRSLRIHRLRSSLVVVCLLALAALVGDLAGRPGGSFKASASLPERSAHPDGSSAGLGTEPPGAGGGSSSSGSSGLVDPATNDIFTPVKVPAAGHIEVYAGAVSVLPGQPIALHVSTQAREYGFRVERFDATLPGGVQIVATVAARPGRDYWALATMDRATLEVRANWPVTDTLPTTGWTPGVYLVTARDSAGTDGRAIFVVRTPSITADAPCFVWSALTYQAYNAWGGADLYVTDGREGTRASFERPYVRDGGAGFWQTGTESRNDATVLAWLQRQHLALQFTTDYDLSLAPPAIAPRLLIFGRHTEYVGAPMRDWVEQHVNSTGDMNVLNFGANAFYWQVRLARPANPAAPLDVVSYKHVTIDPAIATNPGLATIRWRDAPVNRPEGAVLGAQYAAVVDHGTARFDLAVTADMPAQLLTGTGWTTGTTLRGLLRGEADVVYPGSGGIAIFRGTATNTAGAPFATSVTIRTSPAGARVFDAGTFAWADGFDPSITNIGVSTASFDRFNRNVLAWLGFPPGGS